MPGLTHRKRTYLNCERHRMDFKITVKHINFKTNTYFIANSHYVIFRKGNKNKKFKSKSKAVNAADLQHLPVDERIKFRACLLQDLQHKYLERFIAKEKRFVLRQVTETSSEELYVDCGHFLVPLHVYALLPSGQNLTVELKDPNGMASGTVELFIEHEPNVLARNYLPNFAAIFRNLFATKTGKKPLPPSVLETNRDKLEFLKKKKLEHHHGKYDFSDGEEETHSESEDEDLGDDPGQFGSFKFGPNSRKHSPKNATTISSITVTREGSVDLTGHLFQFGAENHDDQPTTPSPIAPGEKSASTSGKSEHNAGDTPRSVENDSVSTITVSVKGPGTPQHPAGHLQSVRTLPELAESEAAGEGSVAEAALGRNHVPFASKSSSNSSPSAVRVAAVPAVTVRVQQEVDEWEKPSDEWLATPVVTASVRGLLRANTENSHHEGTSSVKERPTLERKPSIKQPVRMVSRANTAPGQALSARELLSMPSEDDRDRGDVQQLQLQHPGTARSIGSYGSSTSYGAAAKGSSQAPSVVQTVPTVTNVPPTFSKQPPPQQHKTIKVPVRLTKETDASAALLSPPPFPQVHVAHRAQSTGDLRQQQHQGSIQPGQRPSLEASPSVKELRRNFERPPLQKEGSGSSASHSSYSHSGDEAGDEASGGATGAAADPKSPLYIDLSKAKLPPAGPPKRMIAREESARSCSTLSTHTTLPPKPAPAPGAPGGKKLVPVRLQSPQEEQQLLKGGNPVVINTNTRDLDLQQKQQQQLHHLHRTATAPTLASPAGRAIERDAEYRSPHLVKAPQHIVVPRRMPHAPPPPSGEKAVPVAAPVAGNVHQHHLHRTATAPVVGRDANEYARSLQAVAYGGGAPGSVPAPAHRSPSPPVPAYRPTDQQYPPQPQAPLPHKHQHHAMNHAASMHVMAPPIRLQSNDYIPEGYERYTHIPGEVHRRNHQVEANEQHRGEYLRELAYDGGVVGGMGGRRSPAVYA